MYKHNYNNIFIFSLDSHCYLIFISISVFTLTLFRFFCSVSTFWDTQVKEFSGTFLIISCFPLSNPVFHDISNFTFNLLQKFYFASNFLGTENKNKVIYITSIIHWNYYQIGYIDPNFHRNIKYLFKIIIHACHCCCCHCNCLSKINVVASKALA